MVNPTRLPKTQTCLVPSNPKSVIIPRTGKFPSQAQGLLLCICLRIVAPLQSGLLFGIGPRVRFYWYVPYSYFTRCSRGPPVQDITNETCRSTVFVDDSWVVALRVGSEPLSGPEGILFFNTKQAPLARTTCFLGPRDRGGPALQRLVSHQGGYKPSREDELFAPFYPDPSQRVFVVETSGDTCFLIIKTEVLLRLAQERGGENLRWEEWGVYATRVSRDQHVTSLWVSGPRLFCVYSAGSEEAMMDVYDFSARASARYAKMVEGGSAARYEPSITQILPWRINGIANSYGCHDSITFTMVKFPRSLNPTRD